MSSLAEISMPRVTTLFRFLFLATLNILTPTSVLPALGTSDRGDVLRFRKRSKAKAKVAAPEEEAGCSQGLGEPPDNGHSPWPTTRTTNHFLFALLVCFATGHAT